MTLAINFPADVPTSEPPDWVATWLAKRTVTEEQKTEKAEKATKPTATSAAAQEKRIAKRQTLILNGMDAVDLWMNDLIRAGLASTERESSQFWEHQAKRLVDAQAPGLAAQLRQMSGIPGATPDWPARLLERMGRVALLTQAYRHLESFAPTQQDDLRQLVGWNLNQDEVMARGEAVADDWVIVGQRVEEDESRHNMHVQRTWFIGMQSRRQAMLLQFSVMNAPYKDHVVPGMRWQGTLRFYPGSAPTRAIIETRQSESPLITTLPGTLSITAFLQQQAELLAQQPWQGWRLSLLHDVVPCCVENGSRWWVRDASDHTLPLSGSDHWKLLAMSRGKPVDLAAEWDGEKLQPLSMVVDERFALL